MVKMMDNAYSSKTYYQSKGKYVNRSLFHFLPFFKVYYISDDIFFMYSLNYYMKFENLWVSCIINNMFASVWSAPVY